ncbi:MAG TPA: helix-turn-helix domain-containing protein [Chthonomonadaceae bacterium]|nr:helix-turn-helix domain-containing protein [Chthonomonadaceae bacterium]
MTRPTLKERQLKLREDAILDSTLQLLAQRGYAAMTMDDVANDVGISKATLYQHFKSKEELAVAVVLQKVNQVAAYVRSIDPALPAIVRLRETVRWIIHKRFGDRAFDFAEAEATIKPLLKRHSEYGGCEQMLGSVLECLIEAAKADGDILPHLSTPVLVQAFLSCIQDGAYYALLREGKCTMEELETTLIGMLSCQTARG